MRTLLVIEMLERLQALDLFAQSSCRWTGRILQQGQVHPLMPPVLLRLARRNAFRRDAGLDQLYRQSRQPACAARSKRRTIVGAQIKRQTKLAECRIEDRPHVLGVGSANVWHRNR